MKMAQSTANCLHVWLAVMHVQYSNLYLMGTYLMWHIPDVCDQLQLGLWWLYLDYIWWHSWSWFLNMKIMSTYILITFDDTDGVPCLYIMNRFPHILIIILGVGGAVGFLVVGTIVKEERPQWGQPWMEQYLISLKYWPIWYTIWADPNYIWGLIILADSFFFRLITFWRVYG